MLRKVIAVAIAMQLGATYLFARTFEPMDGIVREQTTSIFVAIPCDHMHPVSHEGMPTIAKPDAGFNLGMAIGSYILGQHDPVLPLKTPSGTVLPQTLLPSSVPTRVPMPVVTD